MAQKVLIEDLQLGNPNFVVMFAVGGKVSMTRTQIESELESNCGGRYLRSVATRNGQVFELLYGNDGRQPACVLRRDSVERIEGVKVTFDPDQPPFSRF